MIICKSCGTENGDDDDFCGTCGTFLEWVGERTAPPAIEPEPAEVAEVTARPGLIERVKEAITGDGAAPAPEPPPGAPAAAPPVEPAPPPPAGAVASAEPPTPSPIPAPAPPPPEVPTDGASQPDVAPPPEEAGAPRSDDGGEEPPAPTPAVQPAPKADSSAERDEDAARRRAAALVAKAPPAPPKPVQPRPEERRPGKAVRKRPVAPAASAARIRPGDLICGTCGTGNDPERKFCRKDGTSLATAEVAKVPWWWRFRRKKKVRAAGERPDVGRERRRRGGGGGAWRVVRLASAVLVVMALVGTLGPWANPLKDRWNTTYRAVRRKVAPEYYRVRPKGWHESRQLPGQEAEKLSDSDFSTSWSPGGDGVGASVIFVFQERVILGKVIFGTGSSDYINNPRVESVLISYDDFGRFPVACTAEKPWCHLIDLEDTPKPQTRDMQSKHKVTSVRLTIAGTYDAPSGNAALSEVQFFAIK